MADNLKPLVIKVQPKSVPNGIQFTWNDITQTMPTFTKDIITPPIDNKDGKDSAQIGAIVSGMPTIFARANLFKLALNYICDKNEMANGLMSFYKALVDEWRGFIGCLALDYANVKSERIYLTYSDGGNLGTTGNIYEPKGAFGNMLFERKPLWCDQGLAKNDDKYNVPFIEVLTYKGNVVGGTSPESFLFTSVAYRLNDRQPFIGVQSGKFTDPLGSELSQEQLLQLHGYVTHILSSVGKFLEYYKDVDKKIKLDASNLNANLESWKLEIEQYASQKGFKMAGSAAPPVDVFAKPFSTLFNFSSELYGEEGMIYEEPGSGGRIAFDPRKLLLEKRSVIARINCGNNAAKNPDFLKNFPAFLLKAKVLGTEDVYHYFALPLSPLGLNVFGQNIAALVGIDEHSGVTSRLTATFDPSTAVDNLKVRLQLITETGKENTLEEVYSVGQSDISGRDILIWPNFISKQWNRYFMYSEIPQNTSSPQCPFMAIPFVGDVDDDFFRIMVDDKTKNPIYLTPDTDKTEIIHGSLSAKRHIISDNRVADNNYKYEIYESNQPYKGVRFTNAGRESGFAIIRYSTSENNMPKNLLQEKKPLTGTTVGIDFGSTNTSVAFYANGQCFGITFKNRRISLFGNCTVDSGVRPAIENEIFFFQRDEIQGNAIKSLLTIHDSKRLVKSKNETTAALEIGQEIKGGFPCFEKNLPIESVTENRYKLKYNRSGISEIVYNMKWAKQAEENAYKKAYLKTLLLHIYAQLFEEGFVPVNLRWSYPSSMGVQLVGEYNTIWSELDKINPVVDDICNKPLNISHPSSAINMSVGQNTLGGNPYAGGINMGGNPFAGGVNVGGNPFGGGMNMGGNPFGGGTNTGINPIGGGTNSVQQATPMGIFGQQQQSRSMVDIVLDNGPVKFKFTQLQENQSLTEACAVANFLVNQQSIDNSVQSLTLCFDVGGSTTDISAICMMSNGKDLAPAMIKQNSIRFAAQRVSSAARYSKNIKDVLIEICNNKNMRIQGLNTPPLKYSPEMAPVYFDQVLDRLSNEDLPYFYQLIRGKCPEMMSVNIYVTGLIMYYAGQLSYKLIKEIMRLPQEMRFGYGDNWRPTINIVFSGKGSRIFDWFESIDPNTALTYYQTQFVNGLGGFEIANQILNPNNPLVFNATKSASASNVKYEVSMGLALPTKNLMVPIDGDAIEILGEDGFVVLTAEGQKPVPYDTSITPQMMEHIGTYFLNSPQQNQSPCPRFAMFVGLFWQVSAQMFGLKMVQQDFMNAFARMNINSYIKTLPEYYEAVELKKNNPQAPFDFVAPIIILEGMKFYDEFLMQGIQK